MNQESIRDVLNKNETLANEFAISIKNVMEEEDLLFDRNIILSSDIIQKLTSTSPNQFKPLLEDILFKPIIMNTAHPKSSVRKSSRSCIANYVRQYKNLRPILRAFTLYGLVNNDNIYSKQCVMLILPNLLNLDSSVISVSCLEFL